jgi:hypothetical protein
MPWKCPACSTPIRQQLTAAGDDAPRPGVIYRCTVCRLELVLDPAAHEMTAHERTAASSPGDMTDDGPRTTQQNR